jgi:DNA-binding transcriptional LysR family regulator
LLIAGGFTVDIRELGRLDMNLLVALEVLLEERNVSRAAQRLFITQSAMSKTLGRLRELFDDPLFIRKSGGMVPTPRAEQLAGHLPQVLQAVQAMIQPVGFDPLSYEGEFDLMVQGHMGVWILPLLLERLRDTAPGLRLRTLSGGEASMEMLASGELDFVLQAEHKHYPPGFRLATLGYATPVLLARKGHPLEGQPVTWDLLASYPHVRLIIPELEDIQFQGQITSLEQSEFYQRESRVIPHLSTDHLYTAIRVVLASDYLFPAPPLFMEQDELARELIALPLPDDEEIAIKYVMVSHQRIEHSPAHDFLRGEMLGVIEQFRHRYGLPCLEDLRAQRKLPY